MKGLLRQHQAGLVALAVLSALTVLWSTPFLLPLKILAVFFHELAHLLTVLLTGGSPESLSLTPHQGGLVQARGGNRFLILSSGYLGSLLIGLALFMAALKGNIDRWVTALLGATLLIVATLYVREGFAFIFCAGTGAVMLAIARFTGHLVNDAVLRVIGLSSMIYVPLDIFSDTLARSELRSDARMLAEEFGGPTMFWGGLWLVLSVTTLLLALRMTIRHSEA
ncbi:M50 family metallopeptidase [Aliisedimentitalea sp. MJ-SS2]|uniref:M50 family metallopeptidase n=1 Tax=Aliisedimentitalea sp. MJ-SS2 TaxID=3049795 RepID=UPI0029313A59|nr:M50 family metallopeptidase [Alisedimentitalea sp. MJ-SS2]